MKVDPLTGRVTGEPPRTVSASEPPPAPEPEHSRLDEIARDLDAGRLTEDAATKLLAGRLFEALVQHYRKDPQLRARLVRDFVAVGHKVVTP